MLFIDYWTCDECESGHYGMCHKCGECGRIFDNGLCVNINEFPPSEEE